MHIERITYVDIARFSSEIYSCIVRAKCTEIFCKCIALRQQWPIAIWITYEQFRFETFISATIRKQFLANYLFRRESFQYPAFHRFL